MQAFSRNEVRGLLLLSLTAGSADSAGYLGLGHVFTSNMTGNLVLLGIALGSGHVRDTVRSLLVIAVFMLGVAGGTWLDRGIPEKEWPRLASRVFVWEKILLSLLAVAWAFILHRAVAADLLLLVLLAGVMGLQSAALHRLRAPGVATTAVTGTLTALSSNLTALALAHEAGDGGRARFQALVLILYAVGALGGALLMAATPWLAGALPAVVALLVLPGNSRRSRPPN